MKNLYLILVLILGLTSAKAQDITYQVDGDDLYSNECGDCFSGPDYRFRLRVNDNSTSTWSNWNLDIEDSGSCGWLGRSNFSWRDNTSVPANTVITVQLNANEEDEFPCGGNDGDCGGYATVGTDLLSSLPPCTWHYSTVFRSCDGVTWGIEYSYYYTYNALVAGSVVDNGSTQCSNYDPPIINNDLSATTWATYQWEISTDGGTTWNDIAAATGASYDPPVDNTGATQVWFRRRANDCSGRIGYSNIVQYNFNLESTPYTAATGITACEGASTTLIATGGVDGTSSITAWYSDAALSDQVYVGNEFTTPVLTGDISYWVIRGGLCNVTSAYQVDVTAIPASTAPTIAALPDAYCPNTTVSLSASGGISGDGAEIYWYSDANGAGTPLGTGSTISYEIGSGVNTVYARREGTCNNSDDAMQTITGRSFAYATDGQIADNYCTDNDGWHHFYSDDEILFSTKGDLSGFDSTLQVSIDLYGSIYQEQESGFNAYTECGNGLSPGQEYFEMARSWNVAASGTFTPPYDIRFYYPDAEKTAVEAAANAHITNNADCGYTSSDFYWFKTDDQPYSAPSYDGTRYTGTTATTGNGISYVELAGVSSFSGGSGAITLSPDSTLVNVVEIAMDLKLFLSGNYDQGLMGDEMRVASYLPLDQPYSGAPWNYTGVETALSSVFDVSGNDAIVDWVLVSLRDKNDNTNILAQKAALLQRDGNVVNPDGTPLTFEEAPDDYFISVAHRNHLGAMTLDAVTLTATPILVDFSTVATFGTNAQKDIAGINALWAGDSNADGIVDAADRSNTWNERNQSGYLMSNVSIDNVVDAQDRSITWNNRNKSAQLP